MLIRHFRWFYYYCFEIGFDWIIKSKSNVVKEIINFVKQNKKIFSQTKEVHSFNMSWVYVRIYRLVFFFHLKFYFMAHWMGLFSVDRWRTYAVFYGLKKIWCIWETNGLNWKYLVNFYAIGWWYYKLNTRFLYRLHLNYEKQKNVYCFSSLI